VTVAIPAAITTRLLQWTTMISAVRRSRAASRLARVVGVDDLAVVDALKLFGRDAGVRVAERTSDDDERDALASHLDGVRAAQLVRGRCGVGH
jgi:hypothetical protein